MDNGPELIAWTLRDWCRQQGPGSAPFKSNPDPHGRTPGSNHSTAARRRIAELETELAATGRANELLKAQVPSAKGGSKRSG